MRSHKSGRYLGSSQEVVSTPAHGIACSWQLLAVAACYLRVGVERRPDWPVQGCHFVESNPHNRGGLDFISCQASQEAYHDCTVSLEGFIKSNLKLGFLILQETHYVLARGTPHIHLMAGLESRASNLASRCVRVIHALSAPVLSGRYDG